MKLEWTELQTKNTQPQGHLSKYHEALTNQKYLTGPNLELVLF